MTIRAFIGVPIDPTIAEKISQVAAQLKQRFPEVRWVAEANLHFTVKFLGDVEEAQIGAIGAALAEALRPFSRFTLNAKGLGVFPDLRRARILWVGLLGSSLATLAAKVESTMIPFGFAPELKSFKPHLTVGRWRRFDGSPKKLAEELERWKEFEFGQSEVTEVIFFRSVLKPEGAVYQPLNVVRLAAS